MLLLIDHILCDSSYTDTILLRNKHFLKKRVIHNKRKKKYKKYKKLKTPHTGLSILCGNIEFGRYGNFKGADI